MARQVDPSSRMNKGTGMSQNDPTQHGPTCTVMVRTQTHRTWRATPQHLTKAKAKGKARLLPSQPQSSENRFPTSTSLPRGQWGESDQRAEVAKAPLPPEHLRPQQQKFCGKPDADVGSTPVGIIQQLQTLPIWYHGQFSTLSHGIVRNQSWNHRQLANVLALECLIG